MSNIVVIDVGTHKAEELRILSGDRAFVFFMYFKWWFDWIKRQVKKLIRYQGLIKYGAGGYKLSPLNVTLKTHIKYIRQIFNPINYLKNTKVIAIDPVSTITAPHINKLSRNVDVNYIAIAILPHDDDSLCKMTNFYITRDSLSSSLFEDDSSEQELVTCPAYDFSEVIKNIKSTNLISSNSEIVIRMNCEGSELAVINSLINNNLNIRGVLGSIGDVEKKYGVEVGAEMNDTLNTNKISFNYFKGSDPATWSAAFSIMGSQ